MTLKTLKLLAFCLTASLATPALAALAFVAPAPALHAAAPETTPLPSSPLLVPPHTESEPASHAPATPPPAAQTPHPALENYRLSGTLGPYAIGATLSVLPDATPVEAHYFYVTHLVDIPLSVQRSGEQIVLSEADGGRFTLHFETNDPKAPHPLTLYTATALTGTWRNGAKTYPVTLQIVSSDTLAPNALYAAVTNAPPPVFEAMVQRFIRSALSNNKTETAKLVSWPLNVYTSRHLVITTPAALAAAWSRIFTPCMRRSLEQAIPHEMFVHDEKAMIANGAVWFDASGASTVNSTICPTTGAPR
ncbi:hypothetical protein OQ252_11325 [Acetobacter farinalis]|uniref:Uncharacterized protein n=1 Tax=Acetobacter farinalis TaxID=1260984 RepID=A0ABT3Q9L3_9PROT|nr:hypothetical protein [Acetobacter farinalis]MCX2561982.1 hypothetical protein [Acetobacter farinalis]NHO30533.1 hypothetical protein [Acetobacter farinalis]